jgi:transcription termination factor Rho
MPNRAESAERGEGGARGERASGREEREREESGERRERGERGERGERATCAHAGSPVRGRGRWDAGGGAEERCTREEEAGQESSQWKERTWKVHQAASACIHTLVA